MSPSFSSKNGVRYRFYVSSSLLRGRKTEAGSVGRVASATIEKLVVQALRDHISTDPSIDDAALIERHLSRIEVGRKGVAISYRAISEHGEDGARTDQIRLPWSTATQATPSPTEYEATQHSPQPDPKAVQAIVRARHWATALSDGKYASVDELATTA